MSASSLALHRTITAEGRLEFSIADSPLPRADELKDDEVLIRVEAAPINPSDIGPLFSPSYGGIGRFDGYRRWTDAAGRAAASLPIPKKTWERMRGSAAVGRAVRVGNEGAGRVVAAGRGAAAQALMGKLVSAIALGASYGQHAVAQVRRTLAHADGTTAEEAASSFVNPLTALGMVKTMRAEGHTGIVHTAAASQLGQMLVKICLAEDIPLVCVVRRSEQVALLKDLGAKHAVSTSSASYEQELIEAVGVAGATICFDALGGGTVGFEVIKAMETAALRAHGRASNYGSGVFKKLYIYGGLNAGQPLILRPHAGMGGFSWAVAGFVLDSGTAIITEEDKQRVAREIKSTFRTVYSRRLTLQQMLDLENMAEYQAQKSNSKALVLPWATTEGAKL